MSKIIVKLRPFDIKQKFFLFTDGVNIKEFEVSSSELPSSIVNFVPSYSVNQVDLAGPKQYAKGIKEKIMEEDLRKNGVNNLVINII